jgi:putative aldouronate transport system substrate-binding protein
MDDIEAALQKVRAGEPSLSPLVGQVDGGVMSYETPLGTFSGYINMESLGDNVSYVFLNNPWQVVNYFKTDTFRERVYKTRDWYQKGYIYRDAMINQEMPEELVKSNVGFSFFMDSELGIEAAKSAQVGKAVRAVNVHDNPLTTSLMTKFAWGIPSYSKEGEAAIQFLNQLYSRADLSRLLTWGIEGRDYVIKADGTAAYPPGITAQTVPYRQMDFLGANQYLVPPWEGNPPDLRTTALKQNQAAPASPLLGFSYDLSPMTLELTAITNVINEYTPGLNSGAIDPAVVLPRFLKALDDAGAEKLVAEAQRQLNAWRAAVGK